MAPSYRVIDYRVRPAKAIERKMMADAFRRLAPFGRLDAYRYIGFGSLYFSDFIVFHKAIGFKSMISIENTEAPDIQQRFIFNVPYKCIDLKFGPSGAVLPTLNWDVRSVVWLDYDGVLTKDVLGDIEFVISKIQPGSLFSISVNAMLPSVRDDEDQEIKATPVDSLKALLGAEKVPSTLQSKDLGGWGIAAAYRSIIANQIEETLSVVNAGKSPGAKLQFKQIFNFNYEDGARMLTFGGILIDEGQESLYQTCGFSQLDFVRCEEIPYKIETPMLTHKEMRHLDGLIPIGKGTLVEAAIPNRDVEKYETCYRYFPRFGETEAY